MRGTNVQNASYQRCEHPGRFPGWRGGGEGLFVCLFVWFWQLRTCVSPRGRRPTKQSPLHRTCPVQMHIASSAACATMAAAAMAASASACAAASASPPDTLLCKCMTVALPAVAGAAWENNNKP
eukprot:1189899-Prorocentrum_minimum.AAC.2